MATDALAIYMWSLLAFAGLTLLVLIGSVGVYRWRMILSGRQEIRAFRSDRIEGADWYRRAMNAHRNCVENIGVFAAVALVAWASGLRGGTIDTLAVVLMIARVAQSLTHIGFVESNTAVAVRFAFFFVQFVCFFGIGWIIINHTPA